jgi:hypothetical protein
MALPDGGVSTNAPPVLAPFDPALPAGIVFEHEDVADETAFKIGRSALGLPTIPLKTQAGGSAQEMSVVFLNHGEELLIELTTAGPGTSDRRAWATYFDIDADILKAPRVELTTKFQDLIPEPSGDARHVGAGTVFGGRGWYASYFVTDDAVAPTIAEEVLEDESVFVDTNNSASNADVTGVTYAAIVYKKGRRLRAKLAADPTAGKKVWALMAYVVNPDP